MHRINAVSSVKRNDDISTNLKFFLPYNLSLLQTIRDTSFLNLLLDNMGTESILDNITKILGSKGVSSAFSIQQEDSGKETIHVNDTGNIQPYKNIVNNNSKISKNFNRKLNKTYLDISNPLLQVVPSQTKVSSDYGWRNDPFTGKRSFHKGVDISAPKGSPIYPIQEGVVEKVGFNRSYGNYVKIKHDDGTVSLYAHNQSNLVKEGERVNTKTQIAKVGATGRATGSHLHFEILQGGKAVNPQKYVDNMEYAMSKNSLEIRG